MQLFEFGRKFEIGIAIVRLGMIVIYIDIKHFCRVQSIFIG